MRRVCHCLGYTGREYVAAIPSWTAQVTSWKCDLRPVGAIMKHELLLNNLSLLVEVGSGLYRILGPHIKRDYVGRNSIIGVALRIMNDPQAGIWLGSGGVREFGGHETVAATGVGCDRLARSITSFMLIHLESITAINFELESRLCRSPNITIAGAIEGQSHRLPHKKNSAIGRSIKIRPIEGSLVARDLWCA